MAGHAGTVRCIESAQHRVLVVGHPFAERACNRAELLRTMKGRAIVSVNDIPAMREAFDSLPMKRIELRYTVGSPASRKTPQDELLITNFEMA